MAKMAKIPSIENGWPSSMQRPENPAMTPTTRVKIYAATHRRGYELVTRARR
jgi:hypothetical protein